MMKRTLLVLIFALFLPPCFCDTRPHYLQIASAPFRYINAPTDGTDAGAAIRAAIASGGLVYLPEGNYSFASGAATISLATDVTVVGDPRSRIVATASNTKIFDINVTATGTSVKILGLTMDGGNKCSQGVYISQATGVTGGKARVSDCKIKNMFVPTTPPSGAGASGIYIHGGYFNEVEVCDNEIASIAVDTSIDPTTYLQGIISATGILVRKFTDGTVLIDNNYINDLICHGGSGTASFSTQADAVYVTSVTGATPYDLRGLTCYPQISRNTIINCEGRIFKTQTAGANIHHNKVVFDRAFPSAGQTICFTGMGCADITDNNFLISASATFNGSASGGIFNNIQYQSGYVDERTVRQERNILINNNQQRRWDYFSAVAHSSSYGSSPITITVRNNTYSAPGGATYGIRHIVYHNLTATITPPIRYFVEDNILDMETYGAIVYLIGNAHSATDTCSNISTSLNRNRITAGESIEPLRTNYTGTQKYPGRLSAEGNSGVFRFYGYFQLFDNLISPCDFVYNSNGSDSTIGLLGAPARAQYNVLVRQRGSSAKGFAELISCNPAETATGPQRWIVETNTASGTTYYQCEDF